MDEIRCDGNIPVVDMEWELRVVGRQIKECLETLKKLKDKDRDIRRLLGKEATDGA